MEENKKKKISIGLDLGVASCGWAIFDSTDNDNKKLIDLGVRLFEEAADKDNETNASVRREKRATRRRFRRIRFKKKNLIHLIARTNLVNGNTFEEKVDNVKEIICKGICDNNGTQIQPLELRLKTLLNNEQLTNEELIVVLFNYLSHRGFFYLNDEEQDKEKNENDIDILNQIQILEDLNIIDKNNFPSIKYYKKNKDKFLKFIGIPENSKISHNQWKQEVNYLLNFQQKLDDSFKNKYIEIFDSIRPYNKGPGSKYSLTPWGLYKKPEDIKNIAENANLWDETIGIDIINNEIRGLKFSPLSEMTNLLNDLVNLKFFDESEKEPLFNTKTLKEFFNYLNEDFKENKQENKITKANISTILKKIFGYENIQWTDKPTNNIGEDENKKIGYICGFKHAKEKWEPGKDKEKEPKFTELSNTNNIINLFLQNNIIEKKEIDLLDINFLKKINNFFCKLAEDRNDSIKRFNNCKNELFNLSNKKQNLELKSDNEILDIFKKIKKFSKTSSYSYETMERFIKNVTYCLKNSSDYFYKDIEKVRLENKQLKGFYIPTNFLENEILSVNVRRTFIQAINVINKIIHRYKNKYDLSDIVIEMAREKNSQQQKDFIDKIQSANAKFNSYIKQEIDGIEKLKGQNFLRFLLWEQQEHKDIYDGEEIKPSDLLNNPNRYEIDHIIPYSKCGIDSIDNKVLTKLENNKKKGQRTPWEWKSSEGNYRDFENRINKYAPKKKQKIKKLNNESIDNKERRTNQSNNITISKTKYYYLTYKGNDWADFIARNLNDTRFATKLLLNTLQNWISINKNQENKNSFFKDAQVKTLNGSLTNFARKKLFLYKNDQTGEFIPLRKDRKQNNNHHAIDAAIICYLGSDHILSNLLRNIQLKEQDNYKNQNNESIKYDVDNWLNQYKHNTNLQNLTKQLQEITENQSIDLYVKFSFPLIKKFNGQLFNETNYGLILNKEAKENIKKASILKTKYNLTKNDIKHYTYSIDLLSSKIKSNDFDKYFFKNKDFNITSKEEKPDDNKNKKSNIPGEKWKELLINTASKTEEDNLIYKKLCNVYWSYKKDNISNKAKNPFFNYLNQLENDQIKNEIIDNATFNIVKEKLAVPIWTSSDYSKKPTLIKKLRVIKNCDFDNVLHLDQGVVDTLSIFGVRIYKKKDNKPIIINLNIKLLKYKNNKFVPDEEKIKEYFNQNKIERKSSKYIEIWKGTTFLLNQAFFKESQNDKFINSFLKELKSEKFANPDYIRICSIGSFTNGFEVKVINFNKEWNIKESKNKKMTNNTKEYNANDNENQNRNEKKEQKRRYISFKDLKKYFDLCEIDHLGNICKRYNIEEKFNQL